MKRLVLLLGVLSVSAGAGFAQENVVTIDKLTYGTGEKLIAAAKAAAGPKP